jgi:hypothetical protein
LGEKCKNLFIFFVVQSYSETYHESTLYAPRSVGDPIALHWESMPLADKRYVGAKRYPLSESKSPLHAPALADSVQSVAVYAVIRNGSVPDGVYYYDIESQELVNIGSKPMVAAIVAAFPDKDVVAQAEEFYLYAGVMERSVWRFREAAYRQVQVDVGAACANTMIYAKSKGKRVFPVGAFVDDAVAVALGLSGSEIPLAALAVFPENSAVAFNSLDEGVGEFAYSNRSEVIEPGTRYQARFMLQNRGECISDVAGCVKVRRVATSALPGEEFPLAPPKFPNDYFFREIWFLNSRPESLLPFSAVTMDLDDFSSILRWMEVGQFNAFGAGLLKVWVVVFDAMFVYPGSYRYVPVRKSLYMQAGELDIKKFVKCFAVPEQAQNTSFAVIFTADLKEACSLLGERAYRYLNLNAGVLGESLDISARLLNKTARAEHFVYHDSLKKLCAIPEGESVLSAILVGKAIRR